MIITYNQIFFNLNGFRVIMRDWAIHDSYKLLYFCIPTYSKMYIHQNTSFSVYVYLFVSIHFCRCHLPTRIPANENDNDDDDDDDDDDAAYDDNAMRWDYETNSYWGWAELNLDMCGWQ